MISYDYVTGLMPRDGAWVKILETFIKSQFYYAALNMFLNAHISVFIC